MSGPRADPGNTIHQGEMEAGYGRVRWGEREERKKRDPRRDVTLPNHQDEGKARSDSQGSSDSSKLYFRGSHQSCSPKIMQGPSQVSEESSYTTVELRPAVSEAISYS